MTTPVTSHLNSGTTQGRRQTSQKRNTNGILCLVFAVVFGLATAGHAQRTIDGSGNNLTHTEWGAADTQLLRLTTVAYEDLTSQPAGANRPSARLVSNLVCAQAAPIPNAGGASDFVWQWGQFIDHDIDLTEGANPPEAFDIEVPLGDPFFDPFSTGNEIIGLNRSIFDLATGTDATNPRQQVNEITAFIDASNVYGSDETRAAALRTNDGTGRLKTSPGNFLPFNTEGLPNAGGPDPSLFLAGDVRANEQVGLASMHTLFVREHNLLARVIGRISPHLSGDEIYEQARALVGAEIQAITYNEFLPVLLGPSALAPYSGYDDTVDPGITNLFSTASYRFGHSMLSPTLLRLRRNGRPISHGNLPLRDAFFAPQRITDEGGIAPLLRGLAKQVAQEIDTQVVDDVRNFLFGPPGAGGFDLPSLNIQRGRDHGLPGYNQARVDMGLAPVSSFADISSDPVVQQQLEDAYGDVDEVDAWVGGLAEDHLPGALVGELNLTVLKEQFEALRDGDRFWYQRVYSGPLLHLIEHTRLSHIIRRNTPIGRELQRNVFLAP